ncbi:endo-1,4-beta-xylanase [Hymenobacter wooponensis]|uniref:endo-1,4-beta-xylanase n=1 Tax=Hymenobacter wooponensis TaxID=1525360 RepID=UPI0014369C03|nr:endo-1,4-beta-xylanase [Hymenobacter wooponensis]
MIKLRRLFGLLGLLSAPLAVHAQNAPVTVQAEAGTVRDVATTPAAITFGTEAGTGFLRVVGDFVTLNGSTQSPNADNRVVSYNITFPGPGTYDLYARVRIGNGGFNDDSYYVPNSFGTRSAFETSRWVNANGLAGGGYTNATDVVNAAGTVGTNNVWKWVRMSAFGASAYTVPAGGLTQTFEIGSRENGLDIDKFVFGATGVFFTVDNLDKGQQGSVTPPPPPFNPPGPPIATGKPKFLGGVYSNPQKVNFGKYFNQVVSENGGKWGSVEGTRNVMNWTDLDSAYLRAKRQNIPFRMHVLIWGNQQPSWIENLPPAEQLAEIKEWYAAVAQRYPDIAFLEVVNEPTHDAPVMQSPTDQGSGNYIEALGGKGATGWDWVITSFQLARQYFPNTPLMLNDYSVENTTAGAQQYLNIINLLKQRNLIDVVGIQGHAFSTQPTPAASLTANLNLLASAGFPLYITELDIDGLQDEVQLAEYQRVFPLFWEHPAVKGITLWGYRPGHWRTAQGAYLAYENGAERSALKWLRDYVQRTDISTITTGNLAATSFCVGSSVSVPFTVEGAVTANRTFTAQLSDAAGSFTAPTAIGSVTASAAGSYTIAATIPASAAAGTFYRIRVVSTSPSVFGNANSTNLTLKALPTATLSGTTAICAGSSATLSVALTGTAPWSLTYTDGTTPVTVTGITASPYTFSVSPASTSTYSLTAVSDGSCNGSALSGQAVVTVNPLPTPGLAVTPANDVYTGGVPTNLYLGYGPQSVTLTATGGTSYSWSPAAGLSNAAAANPVFTATQPGVYRYVVTVTNEFGCSATKEVTLTVLDVRCSNNANSDKVLVCQNGKVICVSVNAVPAHLKKDGNGLGSCTPEATSSTASVQGDARGQAFETFPNPFTERTVVRFRAAATAQVQLQVYNQLGQLVATLYQGVAEAGRDYETTLEGRSLTEGIYTCRLVSNGKVETKRLVLVK